jgi:hypothetical protein
MLQKEEFLAERMHIYQERGLEDEKNDAEGNGCLGAKPDPSFILCQLGIC